MSLVGRISNLFSRSKLGQEIDAELESHIEMRIEDNLAAGMPPAEARRDALVRFGNAASTKERVTAMDAALTLDGLWSDFRYASRQLRKKLGFTLVCVLTLALGIGANTAVFSVTDAVLLRSLPVADPSRVVYLRTSNTPLRAGTIDTAETFSYPVYDALRRQDRGLKPVMAYVPLSGSKVAVRYGAEPEEAEGDMVSGTFFSGLGVKLARGRGFSQQDEADHAPIAVISYSYWTRRFSRSPDVLGKTLYVNGIGVTIVGVSGEGFEGLESGGSTDFWIPLQNRAELNAWGHPLEEGKTYVAHSTWWCLRLVGRLAPGVSKTQAVEQLQSTFQTAAYVGLGTPPPGEKRPTLSLEEAKGFPGYDRMYGKPLRMLMTMVGLVLVIALSNVVALLLARNAMRQQEFSLRIALGARRWELFRQLMTESLMLVSLGGILAWLLAASATKALAAWAQIESSLAPDHTVLLFTLGILVLTAFLLGLTPLRIALSSGPALALKTSGATANTDAGKSRAGKMIVGLQMTLCMVLLVGGGLLIRSLRNLEKTPLGMRVDGLVVFGVKPNIESIPAGIIFYQKLMNNLRALPGVESVTVMEERLGSWSSDNSDMKVDGKLPETAGGGSRTVRSNVVGPDFFRTLGVPVLAGRDFADADTAASPHVGIINEEFAKRFLPKQNPIGHLIGPDDIPWQMSIVGVVKNHKYRSIDEEPIPMAWYMYTQIPILGKMDVELRVHGEPLAILPAARRSLQQLDANLPLIQPMTQRAQYDRTISHQVLFARLAGFFGLLAVVLVATGLYGTMAYRVNSRTAEIGVRMALGARRGQVMWMVLRESVTLTAIGVGVGLPLATLVGRALTSTLYGVKPYDPASFVFAVVGVSLVAVAAGLIPARRAAGIDPVTALRSE